jgi:selenocysteine-specific elongation factor
MFTVGTAGHVDHGKSTLIEALTGIDPDRLREEKARGMTIDLGFAWLTLPDGREVSIVDVPGHERFIRNMLAGVGGIDVALLVVAADEGVMPQTREHLDILDLLEVHHGVVALTKADLVDDEWRDFVSEEVREAIRPTALAGSPVVAVSALGRTGLDALVASLAHVIDEVPPKRDVGRPRLPVDRVFTLPGFGTVVTGTLRDGSIGVGQELEVVPEGSRTRARGIQTHRTRVDWTSPGRRVAVNVAGLATDELGRGSVLALPGTLRPTLAVDVRVRLLPNASRPLAHGTLVGLHVGTADTVARAIVLDGDAIEPGAEGWVNFRLAHPVAVAKDDDFIVRALSPAQTLGGGRIVDPHPPVRRRRGASVIASLQAIAAGTPGEVLLGTVARLEPCARDDAIHASGLSPEIAGELFDALLADGEIVPVAGLCFTAGGWEGVAGRVSATLQAYHRAHPIRAVMPKEELRGRIGIVRRGSGIGTSETRLFGGIVARMATDGVVVDEGTGVRRADHEVVLDGQVRAIAEEVLSALRAAPFAPPTLDEVRAARPALAPHIDDDLVAALVRQSLVVRVADALVFTRNAHDEIARRVVAHLGRHGSITVAEARDLIGTSRKHVLPFLEYLDRERYTRRAGDVRHFGTRPVPPEWVSAAHDAALVRDATSADAPQ